MTVQFNLNSGKTITAKINEFNSEEFAKQLNNPQVLFMTIGNYGFQKHMLLDWSVVPDEEQ